MMGCQWDTDMRLIVELGFHGVKAFDAERTFQVTWVDSDLLVVRSRTGRVDKGRQYFGRDAFQGLPRHLCRHCSFQQCQARSEAGQLPETAVVDYERRNRIEGN